jgi:hypothetical protein
VRPATHGERGTSIVELALILPVIVMLSFGTLDMGLAVFTSNALANAARDGARFASVDPNNTACIASVAAQRSSLARLSASDVEIDLDAATLGQPVTVSVQSRYEPITPLIEELIGDDHLTLRASATMRIRNVPGASLGCATPAPAPTATPSAATPTASPPAASPTAPAATPTAPAATATAAPPTSTPVPPTATPCVGPPGQCKKDN